MNPSEDINSALKLLGKTLPETDDEVEAFMVEVDRKAAPREWWIRPTNGADLQWSNLYTEPDSTKPLIHVREVKPPAPESPAPQVKHSKGDGWCIICDGACILAPTPEQRIKEAGEVVAASVREAFANVREIIQPPRQEGEGLSIEAIRQAWSHTTAAGHPAYEALLNAAFAAERRAAGAEALLHEACDMLSLIYSEAPFELAESLSSKVRLEIPELRDRISNHLHP